VLIAKLAPSFTGGKVFDFGSQFKDPASNSYADDGDCKYANSPGCVCGQRSDIVLLMSRPPSLPKAIYKDDFQGKAGIPSIWMLIAQYSATVAADHTASSVPSAPPLHLQRCPDMLALTSCSCACALCTNNQTGTRAHGASASLTRGTAA
jgi:hypothetical protein